MTVNTEGLVVKPPMDGSEVLTSDLSQLERTIGGMKALLLQQFAGQSFKVGHADHSISSYEFSRYGTVKWDHHSYGSLGASSSGEDRYEVCSVGGNLFCVQICPNTDVQEATTLFVDLVHHRTLTVRTILGDGAQQPVLTQQFVAGELDDARPDGAVAVPSAALVGQRVVWELSDEQAYEHVYLSPDRFTWQGLNGPRRGVAATDDCTTYMLRRGCYVFGWRERDRAVAGLMVSDMLTLRGDGMLFGAGEAPGTSKHLTFGAQGTLSSVTAYDHRYDPRGFAAS